MVTNPRPRLERDVVVDEIYYDSDRNVSTMAKKYKINVSKDKLVAKKEIGRNLLKNLQPKL